MKTTKEKNMVNRIFLRESSLICLLVILIGCSTNSKIKHAEERHLDGLLRNFKQANKSVFTVSTPYKIEKIENVSLSHENDFNVLTVRQNADESILEIIKTTDNIFQGLTISFYDNDKIERRIRINFYSKIIDIKEIGLEQDIVYNKKEDIVPPLFIKTSIQVGQFIICQDGKIDKRYDFLSDLYFFSLFAKLGDYQIGGKDCENIYFNFIIQ